MDLTHVHTAAHVAHATHVAHAAQIGHMHHQLPSGGCFSHPTHLPTHVGLPQHLSHHAPIVHHGKQTLPNIGNTKASNPFEHGTPTTANANGKIGITIGNGFNVNGACTNMLLALEIPMICQITPDMTSAPSGPLLC